MNWFVSRSMPILPGVVPPPPTGPQLYQLYVSAPTTTANATETNTIWSFTPTSPVGLHNCGILSVTYPSGTAPTITDNNGNSWTGTLQKTGTGGGNDTSVWVKPNLNAGVTKITITFGAAQQPVWWKYQEWSGIATSSPTNGTVAAAAPVGPAAGLSTGSFTPGANADGNLILAFFDNAFGNEPGPTGWVAGTSFTLMEGSAIYQVTTGTGLASASEYFVQSSPASINPGITATANNTSIYNAVAIALKISPSAGTARPAGIRIIKGIKQTTAAQNSASAIPLNFPTLGNLRVFTTSLADSGSGAISSVTDSEGNTWTNVSQSTDTPAMYYFKNAVPNPSLVVTLHVASPNSGQNMDGWFLDIAGAATGTVVGAVGHRNTAGDSNPQTHMPDITPTSTSSLIVAVFSNGLGPTLAPTSPSGAIGNNVIMVAGSGGTGENDGGQVNSGDGFASLYNTSLAAQNWTWPVDTLQAFNSVAVEFLPA